MRNLVLATAIVLSATSLHAQETDLHFKERPDTESAELDLKTPADDPNAMNQSIEEVNIERAGDAVVVSTARTRYAQAVNDEGKDRIEVQTDKDVAVIRVDKSTPMREVIEKIERLRAENPNGTFVIESGPDSDATTWSFYQTVETEENEARADYTNMAEMVELSFANNPELQAVRAELAAAQARVKQMELRTASELMRRQNELKDLEKRRKAVEERVNIGTETSETLIDIDARIQENKAQLRYLLGDTLTFVPANPRNAGRLNSSAPIGTGGGGTFSRSGGLWIDPQGGFGGGGGTSVKPSEPINWSISMPPSAVTPRPSMDDLTNSRVRDLLNNPVSLTFDETPVADICDFISDTYEINFSIDVVARNTPITVNLNDVTIHDALLAIAEANQLVFIIRDYGIFVTTQDRAHSIPGPSIPEGLPYAGGNGKTRQFLPRRSPRERR